jgi:hypothetical protein
VKILIFLKNMGCLSVFHDNKRTVEYLVLNKTSLNAELNSLQDGIFRFALASFKVSRGGGQIIMKHPVHAFITTVYSDSKK